MECCFPWDWLYGALPDNSPVHRHLPPARPHHATATASEAAGAKSIPHDQPLRGIMQNGSVEAYGVLE